MTKFGYICLAHSAKLPEGLYILLALISFFYYEQSYLSIYCTDFHDLFTKWKVFAWVFLIRSILSDSSRDVAMATNLVAKIGQNYLPPALIALSIQNGMGYRYLNVRVNSKYDASISCKNFVNFGPVTLEKTGLICILFLRHGKKLAYLVKYLNI